MLNVRGAEQVQRDDRLGGPPLDDDQQAERATTAATTRPMIVGEPHAYSVPPHVVNSTKQVTAAVEQGRRRGSRCVGLPRRRTAPAARRGDEQGGDAERDVDVEDPAPRQVVGEEAAEQRPGDARRAEHGAEVALVAAPLPRARRCRR